jgi:hypothetical protein
MEEPLNADQAFVAYNDLLPRLVHLGLQYLTVKTKLNGGGRTVWWTGSPQTTSICRISPE